MRRGTVLLKDEEFALDHSDVRQAGTVVTASLYVRLILLINGKLDAMIEKKNWCNVNHFVATCRLMPCVTERLVAFCHDVFLLD